MSTDRRIRTSLLSIASDIVLISAKAGLGMVTGSMALKADAMHSASDLGISSVVLLGLLFRRHAEKASGRSADNRPARLCRIEAGLSYVIACLILYAPYDIVSTLLSRRDGAISHLGIGVAGILGCISLTWFIARLKLRVGKETGSAALIADGYHSSTDFFSSIAVLFAVMGDAIGVRIDPVVAALIALLIGVTGIELFVASTRALVKGEPLKTDDLGEWIASGVRWLLHAPSREKPASGPEHGTSSASVEGPSVDAARKDACGGRVEENREGACASPSCARRLSLPRLPPPRRVAPWLAVAAAIAWLLSGLVAIQPDEVGVRIRFGKVVGQPLQPGLHLALPRPIESVLRHRPGQVRRVEVGFRTSMDGRVDRLFDESIVVAGDESVVDLNLAVHYTARDPLADLFRARSPDDMVRALAESSVREVMATKRSEMALADGQEAILREIRGRLSRDLDELGLGLSLVGVMLTDARPPSAVMPAFRDVFSAREDQLKVLQMAEAKRNESIPKARAESAAQMGEAASFALERRLHTEGDARRFALQAEGARAYPEVTAYRLFIETAEKGLAGHRKIVADPVANFGGYQLWLFGPTQPPVPVSADPRAGTRKNP